MVSGVDGVCACSKKYGIRPASAPLPALLLVNADFAFEWRRPLPPNVKMIGPAMIQPPSPLPLPLQVCNLIPPTLSLPHGGGGGNLHNQAVLIMYRVTPTRGFQEERE